MAFNGDPKQLWVANPAFDVNSMWERSYVMHIEWLAEGAEHLEKSVMISVDEHRSLTLHPDFPRIELGLFRRVPHGLDWLFGPNDPTGRPALAAGMRYKEMRVWLLAFAVALSGCNCSITMKECRSVCSPYAVERYEVVSGGGDRCACNNSVLADYPEKVK